MLKSILSYLFHTRSNPVCTSIEYLAVDEALLYLRHDDLIVEQRKMHFKLGV